MVLKMSRNSFIGYRVDGQRVSANSHELGTSTLTMRKEGEWRASKLVPR